ncbi:hypothetical protein IV203_029949 [Nitzschia inconspicua]|uniref:Uncharacterized protein n=1 Tax=Nitzschia inconspicua TaxID=303405 RepID=A0A9K3LSN4_9STRA|nr:hypothetical protein IV203_029949 [Nitzschia inconspicua]
MNARVQGMMAFLQDDDSSDSSEDEIAVGPSWMNKFSQSAQTRTSSGAPKPVNTTITGSAAGPKASSSDKDGGEPAWMQKFGMNNQSYSSFNNSATSLSSSTHSFQTEETPEWMQKLKLRGSQHGGGSTHGSHQGSSTFPLTSSSSQQQPQSPGRTSSNQSVVTPSTPSWVKQCQKVGGTPSIPSVPSLNHTVTTPAWRKSALNNSISSITSPESAQQVSAPETPNWMRKFDLKKQVSGIPKAPGLHSNYDDDDDRSVSSFASIQSSTSVRSNADPEWMGRFNRVKAGDSGGTQLPKVLDSTTDPGAEPEWMKRFMEIGMTEKNPSPKSRSTITKTGVPPRPPQNSTFAPYGNSSTSNRNGRYPHPGPPKGMVSAPSSPSSARLAVSEQTVGGIVSAPSSPVAAIGLPKVGSLYFSQPHGLTSTMQQRRQSLGSSSALNTSVLPPKLEDPAAVGPEKLDWMNKVKAVAKNPGEKPAWMQKLVEKIQGNDLPEEKNRSNKTPPWKQRERLKEEQAKQLRESLGLDLGVEEGKEEDDLEDGSWGSGDESSVEEEELPEWMKQFRKMDLKAATVVTAQGRAPQTVSLLRTGSARMTTRTGDIVDDSQVIKAITVRSHSSRSLKLSRHASFKNGKLKKEKSKRSVVSGEDASESSFAEQEVPILPSGGFDDENLDQATTDAPLVKSSQHTTSTTANIKIDKNKESSALDYRSLHSTDLSVYSDQVEIDNSAPENVMTKWGETIKAKKPGNSTLMSWRMIQNQADKVKERIEKAKKGASADSEERIHIGEGKPEKTSLDESATALFFSGGDPKSSETSTSFAMDNSAANLFSLAGDNKSSKDSTEFNMDASAANIFGVGSGDGSGKKVTSESINMENSAALLFGLASAKEDNKDEKQELVNCWDGTSSKKPLNSGENEKSNTSQAQGSLSDFLDGSKSANPKNETSAVQEALDESSSSSSEEMEGKKTKPSLSSYEPRSFATTAAVVSPPTQKCETKKKSILNDSDSEDSDSDDNSVSKRNNTTQNDNQTAKTIAKNDLEERPKVTVSKVGSVAPPQKKKSFLDDSDSEDDSSSDESTPKRPPTKGRLYAPNKTESTIPLISGKKEYSDSDNSDDDSNDESTNAPQVVPVKEEFELQRLAETSSADFDSFGEHKGEDKSKVPASDAENGCDEAFGFDFASENANQPSESPLPIESFAMSDKATDFSSIDAAVNDKKFEPKESSVKPDELTTDVSVVLSQEERPEDKLQEDEWQAALMGLAAEEEKKKEKEKEQWESDLLKLEAGCQEEKKSSFSPKIESKPKNKANPAMKGEKKEIVLSSKKNAASPTKEASKKVETSIQRNEKKIESSSKKNVCKSPNKEEKKENPSSQQKKKDARENSLEKRGKKSQKDSPKILDSSRRDEGKVDRKRDSSKDPPKGSSKKESSSKDSSRPPKSPSLTSKTKESGRGRTETMKSPRSTRSKSSNQRKRDKSKDRSSSKSRSSGKRDKSKEPSPSKSKSSEKRPSKVGLPPLIPSKPIKGTTPANPKNMVGFSIKPKSSKNTTISKPKSSANLTIKPKSKISLIPSRPKSKANLIPSKPKSKKISPSDFDDDDSFVMNDFDDDFSALADFGDFAEDGSVIPLKAVRNPPSVKQGGKKASSTSKADSKSKKKDSYKAGKSSRTSRSKSKDRKKSEKKSEKKSDKKKSKKK